jgi:hypothetical protein
MRTTKEVKVVQVDQTCDVCHVGLMRPTGTTVHSYMESSEKKYTHACSACGHRAPYLTTFPSLEYHPISLEVEQVKLELKWRKAFTYLVGLSILLVLLTDLWYNGERSVFAMLYKLPITIVSLFVG